MKKVLILSLSFLFSLCRPCFATDHTPDDILSWMALTPKTATMENVTSLLGTPAKVEESKKKTLWYYTHDNTDLVISWNNKSGSLEKYSFSCKYVEKPTFDNRLQGKLRSGTTNISQAVKLLGLPHDMTVKTMTQEMHYAYQNSVLRLFFRNGTLVDFTLLSQQSH